MKFCVKIIFAVLLFNFPMTMAGASFYGFDEAKERKAAGLVERALSRSLEKGMTTGQNVSNRKIVISAHRGFIVVSYLHVDERARGGRMHYVYEPKSDKIVYVLGED
jgi:hypothetical protein